MREPLHQIYGSLLEEALLNEIEQVATVKEFSEGDVIIDFGDKI
jgi:CRP/FNR family transcriptional regulator